MYTTTLQSIDYQVLTHSIYSIVIIIGGSFCTATLAYWAVWKKIIKPQFIKREEEKKAKVDEINGIIKNQQIFFENIESMTKQLVEISAELKPNGGSSMKDILVKTHSNVKYILSERDAEFQLSKNAMFRNNGEGYCIAVNKMLTDLFGATEQQMLGLGWVNFIIESDRSRVKSEWENITDSGSEISTTYHIHNPITDEVFPIKYRAIVNRDIHSEHIISILGKGEKINEYKNNKIRNTRLTSN